MTEENASRRFGVLWLEPADGGRVGIEDAHVPGLAIAEMSAAEAVRLATDLLTAAGHAGHRSAKGSHGLDGLFKATVGLLDDEDDQDAA